MQNTDYKAEEHQDSNSGGDDVNLEACFTQAITDAGKIAEVFVQLELVCGGGSGGLTLALKDGPRHSKQPTGSS